MSVTIESPIWYARYSDHRDIERRVSTSCRDKQAAQQVLCHLQLEVERIDSGLKSPEKVQMARLCKQPVSSHIKDYLYYLANKTTRGRKTLQQHVDNVRRKLANLVNECHFNRITDITRPRIARWMNTAADAGQMSGRTINTYRSAILSFCRWALSDGRLATNPLEGLHTADEMEKRRKRRALTED